MLKKTIDPDLWRGENLMSVADDAYQKKTAKIDDDELEIFWLSKVLQSTV